MRSIVVALSTLALVAMVLAPVGAQQPSDEPPETIPQAVSLLPPGNSGFVSVDGQAAGTAGGSYGDNLDDQSELYWGLEGYAGQGFADPADAERTETLLDGAVRIYWDSFGVPAIYGDTGRDVWYGAGYAIAQIRLFLMDAVRRQGRGTFAELVGTPGVSMDVMTRTLTYTDEEYMAFFESLSPEAQDAFEGYVEGANAWIDEVTADPSLLPVEYALLNTTPEPLDLVDVLAAGVLITRTVAAEGGQEMDNVRLLRDLEDQLGEEEGRGVFTDLVWQDDSQAVTTVPREEGTFPNTPIDDPDEAFETAADYAADLPLELADGPGTGAFPAPQSLGPPATTLATEVPSAAEVAQTAADALADFAESLHGGSIGVALGPTKTANGEALLLSGPQLGYSYPSLLVELEVHGGGYHARGASVPALPTVGIGYTDRVAWALTTGYSKTIDSFIETVRGPADALEYFHDEEWKPAECRAETIGYRETAADSLPVGPPVRSVEVPVCRTVHGPIVSLQDGDSERLARSVQYQMFFEEAATVEGVLGWNRAQNLEEFEAAMRQVTWNENTTYADADGHIAYWHPGMHRQRPEWDLRLPMPGDGSADFGDRLAFEELPHAIDPAQGWLANWNNKPAHEWFDGIGIGPTSRPGGVVQRVSNAIELVESRDDHTFETLQDLEVEAGLLDPRAAPFVPLVTQALAGSADERLIEVAALLASWNRRHHDPPNAPPTFQGPGGTSSLEDGTDGPAATVFAAVLEALLAEVFDDVWGGRIADADAAAACNSGSECPDLVARQLGVGSHRYDASPAHNLLLRILDTSSSGLEPSRDYLDGRTVEEVIIAAAEQALSDLEVEYGSTELADYRRSTHQSEVSSLTGVTGPSATQPYQDRGSYIHAVGFDPLEPIPVVRAAGPERIATSIEASRLAHPDGADTVVIATSTSYQDGLLASPLLGAFDAPLLLVEDALRSDVAAEIDRLGAATAIIVGSTESVPASVADDLAVLDVDVRRLSGDDPFEVGAAVAAELAAAVGARSGPDRPMGQVGPDRVGSRGAADPDLPDAYIVTAEDFPDAVAIGGVSARTGVPVLMVTGQEVPAATAQALDDLGAEQVAIVGGTAVVSDAVETQLPAPTRLAGPERYTTAEAVLRHARALGLSLDSLVLATGAKFPDSLSAAGVAQALDGVVVLVDGLDDAEPGAALRWASAQRASTSRVVGVGGSAVISEEILGVVPASG